jgi:hypothetical protein
MPQTFNVGGRSVFVTTLAWIAMGLALLTVASTLVRHAAAGSVLAVLPAPRGLSKLIADYLTWITAAGLMLGVATLVSAVGLLFRLNWARCAFIGLLGIAILVNLGALWLQHELVQNAVSTTLGAAALPAPALHALDGLAATSRFMGALMTITTSGFLLVIILRLMSPVIRQEFS